MPKGCAIFPPEKKQHKAKSESRNVSSSKEQEGHHSQHPLDWTITEETNKSNKILFSWLSALAESHQHGFHFDFSSWWPVPALSAALFLGEIIGSMALGIDAAVAEDELKRLFEVGN